VIERDQNGRPTFEGTTIGAMQIRDLADDGLESAEIAETSRSCVTVEGGEVAIDHYEEHREEVERVDEQRDQYWHGVMTGHERAGVRWSSPGGGPKTDATGLLEGGEDDDR